MNQLTINQLYKSYGDLSVLNNVHLECNTGDIIGVFGRNGTGKSTLLKAIFGVIKADSLQLEINGEPLSRKRIIPSKQIGYLPQDSFLPQSISVRSAISMYFPDGEAQNKVFYAPKLFSFEHLKVGNLSMGQLRYLELLLIGNLSHEFLLLDEPFSMIEPLYKDVIKDFLIELTKTKGIILTDHYYEDVLQISTKNFIIKEARMHVINTKKDLVEKGYLRPST